MKHYYTQVRKNGRWLLLFFFIMSSVFIRSYAQTIKVADFSTSRSYGIYTFCLNGNAMVNALAKLTSTANFGVGGTVPHPLNITGGLFNAQGSVTAAALAPYDILYIPYISSSSPLTSAEVDAIYVWSLQPGKVVISGEQAGFSRYSNKSGYNIINGNIDPSTRVASGDNIFHLFSGGTFGTATSIYQTGTQQGYFNADCFATVIGKNASNNSTIIFSMVTRDIYFGDGGFFTTGGSLGNNVTVGPTITSSEDKVWANTWAWAVNEVLNPGNPSTSQLIVTPTQACIPGNGKIAVASPLGNNTVGEPYSYSLDNITYQSSPNFVNLAAGNYTVYAKTASCGLISTTVTLASGVDITTQPTSKIVCVGTPTTFSGAASGVGALTYQWLFNGVPLIADHSDVNGTYTGSTTSTLNFTPGTGTYFYGGSFSLRVTNAGGCTVTSNAATITVKSIPTTPVITTTAPTCAVLTGSINVQTPVSGITYILSPGGTTSTTGVFSGLAAGSGPYTVTGSNGTCSSAVSNALSVAGAASCNILLSAKVFLEGSYTSGSTMRNDLYTGIFSGSNLLPLTQPYSSGQNAASTYPGTESVTSFPATAVDWVLVHLRSTANGNNVQTKAGILLKNGDIVAPTAGFASPLSFTAAAGSYYVVVNHRNHLGVMSAAPVPLSAATTVYDFTTGNNKAYTGAGTDGNNTAMVQLGSGLFGLWAGDANHDGQVYYYGPGSDAESISIDYLGNDPENSYNNLYEGGDINMDGQTYYYGPGSDPEYLSITALSNDPENGYLSEQVPVQASPGGRMMMPARRGPLPKKK